MTTQDDITRLEEAYETLVTGDKEVSINIGGDSVQYGPGDAAKLQALINRKKRELGQSGPQFFNVRTGKGIY